MGLILLVLLRSCQSNCSIYWRLLPTVSSPSQPQRGSLQTGVISSFLQTFQLFSECHSLTSSSLVDEMNLRTPVLDSNLLKAPSLGLTFSHFFNTFILTAQNMNNKLRFLSLPLLIHTHSAPSCTQLFGEGAVLMCRVHVHAGQDPCQGDGDAGEFRCCPRNLFCRQIASDAAAGNVFPAVDSFVAVLGKMHLRCHQQLRCGARTRTVKRRADLAGEH